MACQRLTVDQAANALGISTDAVRKRARRGTLEADKDADGTVYVWLDGGTADGTPDGLAPTQSHLDSLDAQIEYLQQIIETRDRELAEMCRLLAGALDRIPALEEAPSDERESSVSASEEGTEAHVPGDGRGSEKRSWWRRLFE
jgi:hypothetical protein